MNLGYLPQQCIVLVIMLMPDNIICKKPFTFFGPLFGHSGADCCLIAMLAFHDTAQSSRFRSRNHHDSIETTFQTLLKNQCRFKQNVWSILLCHPLGKVDEQGGIENGLQVVLCSLVVKNQLSNKFPIQLCIRKIKIISETLHQLITYIGLKIHPLGRIVAAINGNAQVQPKKLANPRLAAANIAGDGYCFHCTMRYSTLSGWVLKTCTDWGHDTRRTSNKGCKAFSCCLSTATVKSSATMEA